MRLRSKEIVQDRAIDLLHKIESGRNFFSMSEIIFPTFPFFDKVSIVEINWARTHEAINYHRSDCAQLILPSSCYSLHPPLSLSGIVN